MPRTLHGRFERNNCRELPIWRVPYPLIRAVPLTPKSQLLEDNYSEEFAQSTIIVTTEGWIIILLHRFIINSLIITSIKVL